MSLNTVSWIQADWALFLDVDGTLLEIAETPQSVRVSESLKQLLIKVSVHLDGAVALVSGRSIQDLDRLFAPLRPCAAGQHGCERRDAFGCTTRCFIDPALLDAARIELDTFVGLHSGLLLEDKGHSLALHFRRAPELGAAAHELMTALCAQLGPQFTLQAGKCVYEIRSAARSKGTAIAEFMEERPFRGRTPVFIGDDVTDEDGFGVVNELGGLSIRVGASAPTKAQQQLRDVRAVLQWLDRVPDRTAMTADDLSAS